MLALGKPYSVGEIILVPNRGADAPSEPMELHRQPYETGFVERPYKVEDDPPWNLCRPQESPLRTRMLVNPSLHWQQKPGSRGAAKVVV